MVHVFVGVDDWSCWHSICQWLLRVWRVFSSWLSKLSSAH